MGNAKEYVFVYLEKLLGRRRFRSILLLILFALGLKKDTIHKEYGYCYEMMKKYMSAIEDNNIKTLFEDNVYRQKSVLESWRKDIMDTFEESPPKTLAEASDRIEAITGIRRIKYRVGQFLKKGALKSEA